MILKAKQSYSLPVVRKVEEGKNQFYVVENDGIEYKIKLYDFQKTREVPDTLLCHAVALQDGGTILTQDYSMFLNEFYTEGGVYPFKIVSVHTASKPGYYKVRDRNGFNFRLQDYTDARLKEHEDIECRVMKLDGYKLRLKLVNYDKHDSSLPFYTAVALGEAIGAPAMGRFVFKVLSRDPHFESAAAQYEEKKGGWVLKFLKAVKKNFSPSSLRTPNAKRVLGSLIDISLHLLEGSSYLKNLDDMRRRRSREVLEGYVRKYETLLEAIDLVESGQYSDVIDDILAKMKNSGYLYDPGKKLELLISIFTLRPEIVENNMTMILDIITEGNHSNWMQEPFRSAFLRQLDFYVMLVKEKADRASYEDAEGRVLIRKMIQALAIRSLMAGKSDSADLQIDRSALYRYLTFENAHIGINLLDRAFLSITDSFEAPVEYGWNDVNDLKKLSVLLSKGTDVASKAITTQTFEGHTAALHIVGDKIHLSPLDTHKRLKPLLPEGMLPWHNIQIYGSDKIRQPDQGEWRLDKLRTFWKDLENVLYAPDSISAENAIVKYHPEPGEILDIVIDDTTDNGITFSCHIIDDRYEGEGFIKIDNISKYVNSAPDPSVFRDSDGNQYLLRAEVTQVFNDGSMEFSLISVIKNYLEYSLEDHPSLTCMVLGFVNNYRDRDGIARKGYLGFSSDGDPVICLFDGPDPKLSNGDVVKADVEYISEPPFCQAVCKYAGRPGKYSPFNRDSAFRQFILNYSESNVVEPVTTSQEEYEDEDDIQLVAMDVEYVRELIRIIDRVATLEGKHYNMYNYLSFCHLLSMLIDDSQLATYYTRRLNFLRSLETFVNSGYIDLETTKLDEEGYMDYPLIKDRAKQMRVLSYFDKPDKNARLWEMVREEANESTVALAKLALLSNMSMEFKFSADVRDRVNKEISQLLKIEIKLPQLISFGSEESQTLEFKSSFFYDQEFHYNPDGQSDHIIERICGFLNSAQGGQLYIGVNNFGYASGLEEDMKCLYFKGNGTRDAFDLKVRNDIRNKLGGVANDCITTKWANAGGKDVYLINISPCYAPISYKKVYWIRQGTSTYSHDFDGYNKIISARKASQQPSQPSTLPSQPQPSKRYDNAFHTGSLRPNSREEWSEDFITPAFYINFHDNGTYDITEEINWQTDNFLAVRDSELDKHIILVYADGASITVPVADIAHKERDNTYSRYNDQPLIFASIADASDALMLCYMSGGKKVARVEYLNDIRTGSITDVPAPVTTGDYESVILCEMIPFDKSVKLKPLINISKSKTGNGISAIVSRQLAAIGINV